MKIRYVSLFSGIGAFEQSISNIFSDAECICYSEIKPNFVTFKGNKKKTCSNRS